MSYNNNDRYGGPSNGDYSGRERMERGGYNNRGNQDDDRRGGYISNRGNNDQDYDRGYDRRGGYNNNRGSYDQDYDRRGGYISNRGNNDQDYDRGYDRRGYNRAYDTENDDHESGFGQVFRKMKDLERNLFSGFGGGSGSYNTPALTHGGNQGYGGIGGGGDLASMLARTAATPSVVGADGKKQLQWQFNVAGFNQDEVKVSSGANNTIEVHARHEDRGRHHAQIREFTRTVQLPEGVSVQDIKTRLNNNGLLTLTAPYDGKALGYEADGGREVSVGHQQSVHNKQTGASGTGTGGSSGTTGSARSTGTTGGSTTTNYSSSNYATNQ